MHLPRTVEKITQQLSENFKVLYLSGMRQVGKSTVLKRLCGTGRGMVSLGRFDDLELAQTSPSAFFLKHPLPVFIDEI